MQAQAFREGNEAGNRQHVLSSGGRQRVACRPENVWYRLEAASHAVWQPIHYAGLGAEAGGSAGRRRRLGCGCSVGPDGRALRSVGLLVPARGGWQDVKQVLPPVSLLD